MNARTIHPRQGHEMKVLSLGLQAAAICECSRWGIHLYHHAGDTPESKLRELEEAHNEHLAKVKGKPK